MAAIVVPRYVALDDNAKVRAIDYGVAELNGRESLTWANVKLSNSGWQNDFPQVWSRVDTTTWIMNTAGISDRPNRRHTAI